MKIIFSILFLLLLTSAIMATPPTPVRIFNYQLDYENARQRFGLVKLTLSGEVENSCENAIFSIEASDNIQILSEKKWSDKLENGQFYKKLIELYIPHNRKSFI